MRTCNYSLIETISLLHILNFAYLKRQATCWRSAHHNGHLYFEICLPANLFKDSFLMVYWREKPRIISPSFPPSICLSVSCSVSLGLAVWHFFPSLSILLCRRACKHTRACACVRACVSACMTESMYARVLMHACVSKCETSVLLSDTHWTEGKNSVCKQMYREVGR